MKKTAITVLSLLLLIFMNAVNAVTITKKEKEMASEKKILVAYYSYSGNTRKAAQEIYKKVGGDIFEIQVVNAYPAGYNDVVAQAKKELAEDFKPRIRENVKNIDEYDVIFVGSPVWWHTIAPPVTTFLSEHNLSGKTVVPFVTHGGGGRANSFNNVAKLAPNSKVLEGIEFYSDRYTDKEISDWLNKIGITQL